MRERARQLKVDEHGGRGCEAKIRRILSVKAEFRGFLDILREFVEGLTLGYYRQIQTLSDVVSVTLEDAVLDDGLHTRYYTIDEFK